MPFKGIRAFFLKIQSKTAADILILNYFSEKMRLGMSCELSAKQTIHMKCLAFIFSLKTTHTKKKIKM